MALDYEAKSDLFEYLRDNLVLTSEYIDGHVHSVRVSLKIQEPRYPETGPAAPPIEWWEIGNAEIIIPERG